MARSSERLSADAYTRPSVEAYLQAAAEQRAQIELAIAEAERRQQAAAETLEYLDTLRGPGSGSEELSSRDHPDSEDVDGG